MDRADILAQGVAFETVDESRPRRGYAVKIKVDYRKVSIDLRGVPFFATGEPRVYPIVCGDRLYFMTTEGDEGYKLSKSGRGFRFCVGGFTSEERHERPFVRNLGLLEAFEGEYETAHVDPESELMYINKREAV